MKSSSLCCALLAVLALATTAQAARLLCHATPNLNGVPSTSGNGNIVGTRVFTFYLAFDAGDIVPFAPTATLSGTFSIEGVDGGQIRQLTGAGNQQTRQGVQDRIDQGTESPGASNESLRNDSWWYASPDGNVVSHTEDPETGEPIVTPLGPVWRPTGAGITGGTFQGQRMDAELSFGPLSTEVTPGAFPLVQVRATGDFLLGGEIRVGDRAFDIDGLPSTGDPATNIKYKFGFAISMFYVCLPEPSTLALAGMGLIGLACLARKRRKESSESNRHL